MAAPALALSSKQTATLQQLGIHVVTPARSPELLAYWDALKIMRDAMWLGDGLSRDGIVAAAGVARYLIARLKSLGVTSEQLKGGRK